MSKIAEKRVKELGYSKDTFNRQEFTANDVFDAAVECYDQTMQDFLEKACEWLNKNIFLDDNDECELEWCVCFDDSTEMIEQFKNYMQDESKD